MHVADGVERVDGVNGNAYVVEAADGLVLVDTGMPGNAGKIEAAVTASGRTMGDVGWILLTHSDPDHIGSVAELKRRCAARVAIHSADAPALRGRHSVRRKGAMGALMGALLPLMRIRPVEPDRLLENGDEIAGLKVVHVPGHTSGSVAFLRADGVMFSGDAALGGRAADGSDGYAHVPRRGLALDYGEALASFDTIEASGYTLLLPGHGDPVSPTR